MNRLRRIVAACLDFVVGDDWRLAVGLVVAIGLVAVLAHHGRNPWWVLPLLAIGGLVISTVVAARKGRHRS